MNELEEELEHIEFLSECRLLVEEIIWELDFICDDRELKSRWDDIFVFGDEPIFTSVLMDALIEENNEFRQ